VDVTLSPPSAPSVHEDAIAHVDPQAPPDLASVYEAHADFVWLTLQRLGVPSADLEDVMQEVFLVVHRRLPEWRAEGTMQSWLYSICRRLASNYRRRPDNQGGRASLELEVDVASEARDPEQAAVVSEAKDRLDAILARLSDDKRVVFVMFELELKPPSEIAAMLSIPIGTVYSRIHAARQEIERIAARLASTSTLPKRTP
jgi:RNA polymerase sigma-70 factor (ECF subfamily)